VDGVASSWLSPGKAIEGEGSRAGYSTAELDVGVACHLARYGDATGTDPSTHSSFDGLDEGQRGDHAAEKQRRAVGEVSGNEVRHP
jgi:ribosome-binding protein aMBF1 (putative translation factor)